MSRHGPMPGRPAMLKISQLNSDDVTTLRLEGKIHGPWVAELRHYFPGSGPIEAQRLDLAGVDYVDGEGIGLLLELRDRGIEIAACTAFVAELLGLATNAAHPLPSPSRRVRRRP